MKLQFARQRPQGHVLFMTMVTAGVIGIALFAYLNLITTQNNFNARSQMWNLCMPIVEAGLEEALSHINNPGTTNFATQGWTYDSTAKMFTKQQTLGTSYYVVQINTNTAAGPTITSTGYVPAPVTVARSQNTFAAAMPVPGVSYISRVVRITTTKAPQLPKALVVKNNINLKGNNVLIDSYNSLNGAFPYVYNAFSGDKGDVTCDNDVIGNDISGNATIKGHLSSGPNATLKLGPNAVVGSAAWVTGGSKGTQPGWYRRDANVLMPDVQPPWTWGTGLNGYNTASGGYKYQLTSGNWEMNGNCILNSGDTMNIKGNASLWIKGNFTMAGTVKANGQGYRLTVYVGGDINFTGFWDKSFYPADLIIYGMPTCTSITMGSSSSTNQCVVYAPEANMSLNGTAQFCGSSTTLSLAMNGNTGYHYDESLSGYSAYRGYVVTSWQEM